ncbi:hypothetical protein IKG20_02655 [Candidatus Saccharibacteria bacterium]|nr:hypothetical protein [Candidatus Saccharibacteria bacterium]
MLKTNKIPHIKKYDSFSVDEPRQAGVLFILFSILGFAAAVNIFCSLPSISERIPTLLLNIFHLILLLAGLSLPGLLIFASIYGFKTNRVYGYINTRTAKPYVKKYVRPISILMLVAGCSTAIAAILMALSHVSLTPSLVIPPVLPGAFFTIGVIGCFAMSGIMLKMEGQIKRAVYSTKLAKRRKK